MAYVPREGLRNRASRAEIRVSARKRNHVMLCRLPCPECPCQCCLATSAVLQTHLTLFLTPPEYSLCRSPDYVASCCNEAGMRREALSGKVPRQWLVRGTCIASFKSFCHACGRPHACSAWLRATEVLLPAVCLLSAPSPRRPLAAPLAHMQDALKQRCCRPAVENAVACHRADHLPGLATGTLNQMTLSPALRPAAWRRPPPRHGQLGAHVVGPPAVAAVRGAATIISSCTLQWTEGQQLETQLLLRGR